VTQAWANLSCRKEGLDLLRKGVSAPAVLDQLISSDPDRDFRQLGIVDANGLSAAWTGADCESIAHHIIGQGFAIQGNTLASLAVLDSMAASWAALDPTGRFATRLVDALAAGESEGGDRRGPQSASVIIARQCVSYFGATTTELDLRVDDSPTPIPELDRLVKLHYSLYASPPSNRPSRGR
jgi:uncharacterized Ntn-hydrolase superfamily protein